MRAETDEDGRCREPITRESEKNIIARYDEPATALERFDRLLMLTAYSHPVSPKSALRCARMRSMRLVVLRLVRQCSGSAVGLCTFMLALCGPGCGGADTSSGGRAGSSGAAGKAGTAGAFGDPTPLFTPLGAARACVLSSACLPYPQNWTGGRCVYSIERMQVTSTDNNLIAFAKCAENASSCTEALSCASRNHGPDFCAAHPTTVCDGDLSVACPSGSDWGTEIYDCAALGMKCVNGSCTDGNSCSGPIVLNCSGSRIVGCDLLSMTQASVDCATVYPGGTCGSLNGGTVQCLPAKQELCPSFTGSTYQCADNVLYGCDGPRKSRLDCSRLDSDCTTDAEFGPDCVPRAHDCTYESPDQCHGTALSICVDGRYQDIDCASLGLGPCQATATSAACGSSLTP